MSPDLVGTFIAVVGPSGAGKDSLIGGARAHFGEDGPIRFVRRVITRPSDAGGEDHIASTDAEFEAAVAAGAFALHWGAHGLRYGIPIDVRQDLAAGRSVLANLSRSAVARVRQDFPRRRIVVVTASPSILAARLAGRGRESAGEIEARLARAPAEMPTGADVSIVRNDGSIEEAERDFIHAISGA